MEKTFEVSDLVISHSGEGRIVQVRLIQWTKVFDSETGEALWHPAILEEWVGPSSGDEELRCGKEAGPKYDMV